MSTNASWSSAQIASRRRRGRSSAVTGRRSPVPSNDANRTRSRWPTASSSPSTAGTLNPAPTRVQPSSWSTASPRTPGCGTASQQTWSLRDTRVTTVDLRGHGRSSKPDGPYDIPTVAKDLAVLIDRLEIDRPIVAGQSWGGNVAVELASGHPRSIRGIVCVDGGWLEPSRVFPDWESCREVLAPPRLAGRPLTEVEAYVRSAHEDWPETGIRGALANFEVRPDGTIAPWLTFDRHIAVLRGLWDHHPSQLYATLAVPVLLVPVLDADGHDADRKRTQIDEALDAIPNARACWFTGHHDIHAQRPDEVADLMHRATVDGFFA